MTDWKRLPLVWGALVLALAGTKMAGSKLYNQVRRETAQERKRMLGVMEHEIFNSKFSNLSDVLRYRLP